MTSGIVSCRWDWCRSSFPTLDALDAHVKHEHIWPMKPMRKADIVLMRRMDAQSLHSSLDTDSNIISGEPTTRASRSRTPPPSVRSTSASQSRNEEFNTFTQLSSPPESHSPQMLPASPALEGLIRQGAHSGLSAAVEMFERTHGLRTSQRLRLPPHQRSPTHRPLSRSSGSSQEVVEQQLTQEDEASPQRLLQPEPENEPVEPELRWPTDDELDVPVTEEMQNSKQFVSTQSSQPGSSHDSPRGQNFRHGSLNVSLGINPRSAGSSSGSQVLHASQGSHSSSEPFVLQTQAPYASQSAGWNQSQ